MKPPSEVPLTPTALSDAEYEAFCKHLETASGIVLGSGKQYLIISRLKNLATQLKFDSLNALLHAFINRPDRELRQFVIDAMTTNETLWFRDQHPFQILTGKLLPEWEKSQRSKKLRIWSAACSSGQEPYSIGISLEEYKRSKFGKTNFSAEIVATDLSQGMLARCRDASYDELSIRRGLSDERLRSYFDLVEGGVWRVKPEIRQHVNFRPFNLLDNYFLLGKFDVIFCRNVLIYFSTDKKIDILSRMRDIINPGGYLFVGSTELLPKEVKNFEIIHCHPGVVYKAV